MQDNFVTGICKYNSSQNINHKGSLYQSVQQAPGLAHSMFMNVYLKITKSLQGPNMHNQLATSTFTYLIVKITIVLPYMHRFALLNTQPFIN